MLFLVVIFGHNMVEASDVYCVKPSHQLKNCGNSSYLCRELQFYASNARLYFTSDTTLEFLPGEHVLLGLNVSVKTCTGQVKVCSVHRQHTAKNHESHALEKPASSFKIY